MSNRCLVKWARSALSIVCGAVLLGSVTTSFAQTTTSGDGGAGGFAGANQPPPLGDPGQVVPGAGGNTDGWSSYGSDPDAMIRAGEANAPGNEYLKVIGDGSVNAARYDMGNDDWLKKSMDLLGDPGSLGDLGEATTSCQDKTSEKTKTETSLYTCETATKIVDESRSCTRIYKPEFDEDYVYECKLGDQWRSDSKVCEPERIVTVDEDYVYSCRTGTVWTHTPASCERKRIVVVDEDYKYGCVKTWNGSTHAPNAACTANGKPGCAPSGGQVCAAPTGLPSSYVCQEGYQGSQQNHVCKATQKIEYGSNYSAVGRITWFNNNPAPALSKIQSYLPGCTISWLGNQVPSGGGQERAFAALCAGEVPTSKFFWDGDGQQWLVYDRNGGTYGILLATPFNQAISDQEVIVRSCPANVDTDPSCRQVTRTCIEAGGYRTISGQQVYRSCWAWDEVYTCGTQSNYAGCKPPAGMVQSGEKCIATNSSGVCTGTEKTFVDPAGGCSRYEQDFRCEDPVVGAGTPSEVIRDVVSDTWDNGCNALAGNGACVKQGEVVIEGNATKVINGLPVTRNPWHVREDYICSSSSNVNSCTPFTGCVQQSQVCASKDRAGNCTAYDRTYRCENPANNGGTPIETPREIVGEYWTDPCATNRNDPSCKLKSNEVVIAEETRVINGMSVTRNPWKRRETWSCDRSTPVNTCTPVAGCELIGKSCAGNAPDGSCSLELNRYRCESPVPNEPVVETPVDWVGGGMHDNACPSKGNGACKLTSTTCSQPGETKFIDGVAVTPPCWEETDTYTCEAMGDTGSNCSPPSGCEMTSQVCLDDVPDDQCKAWENIYTCKKETVVESTTNSCQTKVCIGDLCVGNDDEGDTDMPDALAALLIAQMAGQDYEKDLTIFKGTPMRCRKAVLGFRNCCKDSGWGVDLGLTQCSEEEKTLMIRQEAKATHYVGTYCSQKSFFGICTEKAMRYCAFEGTLAKIVHQAGRPQIGKGWGTPKEADCSGFTVEEFQQLDLTNVDFSEFTDDLMNKINVPDSASTVGRLQQSIEGLLGSGSPGPGETNEAGNGKP